MLTKKMLIALGMALLMTGCDDDGCLGSTDGEVLSIHPLFEERDLILEPALAGSWRIDEGKSVFTFEQKEKGYLMTVSELEPGSA